MQRNKRKHHRIQCHKGNITGYSAILEELTKIIIKYQGQNHIITRRDHNTNILSEPAIMAGCERNISRKEKTHKMYGTEGLPVLWPRKEKHGGQK